MLPPEECDIPCEGNEDEDCGGYLALNLFAFTDGTLPPAPVAPTPAPMPIPPCDTFTLEGCFADSKSGRIMEEASVGADEMSAEVCAHERKK